MQETNRSKILEVKHLEKRFPIHKGLFRKIVGNVHAINDLSFFIYEGETLGLVGESGSGKTTVGRALTRLIEPSAGEIRFRLKSGDWVDDVCKVDKDVLKTLRREVQTVFQDPRSSLDPRMTVAEIIAEPLRVNSKLSTDEIMDKVREMLLLVQLDPESMSRFPHQLSGGQRQRIGIARALIIEPRLIICDEPVSALDVSVQAEIINLFIELQKSLNLTLLFIAHDLSVVEHISDRVAVMYLGRIVEVAPAEELFKSPKHPYTECLLNSIPIAAVGRKDKKRTIIKGEIADPTDIPSGCAFHPRCPYATDICKQEVPQLKEVKPAHFSACLRIDEIGLSGFDEIQMKRDALDE